MNLIPKLNSQQAHSTSMKLKSKILTLPLNIPYIFKVWN